MKTLGWYALVTRRKRKSVEACESNDEDKLKVWMNVLREPPQYYCLTSRNQGKHLKKRTIILETRSLGTTTGIAGSAATKGASRRWLDEGSWASAKYLG